jgi:hypothetical protein
VGHERRTTLVVRRIFQGKVEINEGCCGWLAASAAPKAAASFIDFDFRMKIPSDDQYSRSCMAHGVCSISSSLLESVALATHSKAAISARLKHS